MKCGALVAHITYAMCYIQSMQKITYNGRSMPSPKSHVKFRLLVDEFHYFEVRIFKCKSAMRRFYLNWIRNSPGENDRGDFEAMCIPWQHFSVVGDVSTPKPDMGFILFHKGYFGSGTVAHELTHVAFALMPNFETLSVESEEKFCSLVGTLVRDFWQQFFLECEAHPWLQEKGQ